jgi:hypothetical protein
MEAFLLLQIVSVSYFLMPARISKPRGKTWDSDLDDIVITTSIYACVASYNIWFWWIEFDQFEQTPCGTFALLFFFHFDLCSPICKVQQAFSLICLVCGLPSTLTKYFPRPTSPARP